MPQSDEARHQLAQSLVNAWVTGQQLTSRADADGNSFFPTWDEIDIAAHIYSVHVALVSLGDGALGGHVGWKQGGMGVVPGESCFYGPIFGRGLQQSNSSVSLSRDHVFGVEAEVTADSSGAALCVDRLLSWRSASS